MNHFDTNAEISVIGGLLVDNNAVDKIVSIVNPEMFYDVRLSKIFKCIVDLIDEHNAADVLLVKERLGEEIAPLDMLIEIHQNTPSAANIIFYANLVKSHFQKREAIRVANDLVDSIVNGQNTKDIIFNGISELEKITENKNDSEYVKNAPQLSQLSIDMMMKRQNGEGVGTKTGFDQLDEKLSGLKAGELIIIAARPSMGKTALATNIMQYVAVNHHVLMFSLEMSDQQLADRQLSSISGVESNKILTGELEDLDYDKVTNAAYKTKDLKLEVDFEPALSIEDIRIKARSANRKNKLGLIVIDYLQLIHTSKKTENRNIEVAHISRGLKALAKELKVPVIALSQLSRSVEQRTDKRPMMSDLRESGSIEQDADVVLMLYRDEYYNPDSRNKGVLEVLIRKNRNGEQCSAYLGFHGDKVRVVNLAPEWSYQEPVQQRKKGVNFL